MPKRSSSTRDWGEQNRVGKPFLRGGVELDFEDSRFGGVSAMQIERGGRTAYLMTDQEHLAEVTLEHNTAGNLSGAQLAGIRDIIGAGGRGIEAASTTADRKILLIAEDMPTTRGFTFAWLGDGVRWTPMTYALFPPYKPTGAALLPNGDILVIERRGTPAQPAGTRFARIAKRQIRPGAPIQTHEVARLQPPFVTANFEAIVSSQGLQGQTLIFVASDNELLPSRPTKLPLFELLP